MAGVEETTDIMITNRFRRPQLFYRLIHVLILRLSDELEEKVYLESSQESANEKMFILTQGMDCRRDQINPQSEPKKGRLKKSAGITAPLTER